MSEESTARNRNDEVMGTDRKNYELERADSSDSQAKKIAREEKEKGTFKKSSSTE